VAIWQHNKRVMGMRRNAYLRASFGHIFISHAQKQLLRNFRPKNMTPPFAPAASISYKADVFPLLSDINWIYSMFLCYYVAWPCDFDLWSFDLESVSCTVHLMSDPHTNFYYPTTIGNWVNYEYWIPDHISVIWNSHCACAVSCDI